ncbi:MAG: PLP-dependent aminotransferase family protein [Rhodospirillum sp.]|nr:PLP-dependent aminotransferase family protein [Rhodospirillum sp.]
MDGTGLETYRYEALAAELEGMVERGILCPGMRAPSLRRAARGAGVSLSTALLAYRLLEDRGVLEARPKSGFYVTDRRDRTRPRPAPSRPPEEARTVTLDGGVADMLDLASNPAFAPLGCAIPAARLLAAGGLDRFLARAARVHGQGYNIYTERRGDAALRRELSRRALRHGHGLAPDDIVLTCGCTEALFLALKASTRPGDVVAIESPTYFGLLQILEGLSLRAYELPTHPERGIDPEALSRALVRGGIAACLLSSSFNNPLGCLTPDAIKREIAGILSHHGIPLIEDDIYGDIHFGMERPRPFAALAPGADILTCGSFSKTVAPGYRVGWLAAPGRIEAVLRAKFGVTLCGPALPQKACADFLSTGGYDNHLRRVRRVFAETVARMSQAIDRSFPEDTKVTDPKGGFVLWLELPRGLDSRVLYQAAIRERICFAPGPLFTATDRYRNCLRLSCGHTWDRGLERSVERLGELAREMME